MSRVGLRQQVARSVSALAVVCVAGGAMASGCSSAVATRALATPALHSPAPASPTTVPARTPAASPAGCRVGVSWDNYNYVESGQLPAMNAVFDREGVIADEVDSKDSVEYQEAAIDGFVSKGVDVILLRRVSDGSASPALKRATDAGIGVVAEERRPENPNVLWVNFDLVEAGRMEARAVLAARPNGNYVIIKGHKGSLEADQERQGIGEVLKPALDGGAIKIVAETYTENWDPNDAMLEMTEILGSARDPIDAVIVEDDNMASGVIKALQDRGLEGKVAVGGIGGEQGDPAAVRHLASGSQLVSIWRDYARLGNASAQAVVELCTHRDIAVVTGAKPITSAGGNPMYQVLLQPQTITRDNLDVILEADAWTKQAVCFDETLARTLAACKTAATATP